MKHNFGIYSLFWDWLFGTLWLDQTAAKQTYAKYQQITEEQYVRKQSTNMGSSPKEAVDLGEPSTS